MSESSVLITNRITKNFFIFSVYTILIIVDRKRVYFTPEFFTVINQNFNQFGILYGAT